MIEIKINSSRTGRIVERHLIQNSKPCIQSMANLVLLNDFYSRLDSDFVDKMKELDEYLSLRHSFLSKELEEKGDLSCHYCHRKNLEIGYRGADMSKINNANGKLATIDHKIPRKQCGSYLNTNNWLVACKKCNKDKAETSYEDYMITSKKKRDRNDILNKVN